MSSALDVPTPVAAPGHGEADAGMPVSQRTAGFDYSPVFPLGPDTTPYRRLPIEGVRSIETQRAYVEKGVSKTMNSRHLTGHAVDLYPVGRPTPWDRCHNVAAAMLAAAIELDVSVRWGGDWNMNGDHRDERFYDGPHFELLRSKYP